MSISVCDLSAFRTNQWSEFGEVKLGWAIFSSLTSGLGVRKVQISSPQIASVVSRNLPNNDRQTGNQAQQDSLKQDPLKRDPLEPAQGQVEQTAKSDKTGDQSRDPEQVLQQAEQIRGLAKRDREVRSHEQAHAAIAGAHGGSPQYAFEKGPDGVLYAVSGSVSIDVSPIAGNPEATIRKAETIQRAALAPQNPSAADRSVAAKARSLDAQATVELAQKNAELLKRLAGAEQTSAPGSLISIEV